jgi:deazaflavin-dependent oxidoreductase (nitroreductase family)
MTMIDPLLEESLRHGFRYLNRFMLLLWRLGLGGWLNAYPKSAGQFMVIVHTGRKSGLRRYNPVNFARIDGDIYCSAGFGSVSDWYRNILAQPNVEIWLPDGRWHAVAEEVTGSASALEKLRQVLIASGFAARLVGINAHTMPDERLAAATDKYRLIRLRLLDPAAGANGPGDLQWVWLWVGLAALWWLSRRRR